MPSALAGILGGDARARDLVVRAIGGDDAPTVVEAGPLTIACAGGSVVHEPGGLLCVVDGDLYDLPPAAVPAEVALAAWRAGALHRLRGDFTLVVWDEARGRGALARDHMGGRSLVLAGTRERLCFASATVELLRLLARTPDPDAVMLAHWISAAAPPPERTFYAGVRQLEPGTVLELPSAPSAPSRRFWSGGDGAPLAGARAELVDGLRERLQTAVRRRLPDSGLAGILLSGGLDSSSVGALAAREPSARLAAYSAVFPRHPTVDEGPLIDRLAAAYRVPAVKVEVHDGGVVGGALAYLERWRLPPVSPNLFFWQPLFARAREDGVSVMLDGEGGDELFGFDPYLVADHLRRGRVLAAVRTARRGLLGDAPPPRLVARILLRYGLGGAVPLPLHEAVRRRRPLERYAPPWLNGDAARLLFEHDDQWGWKREPGPRWRAHFRWRTALVGSSIGYEHIRLRAAQHDLRPRHPLADVDVVEYLLRLPPELAFDPHLSRPLLREAVDGFVPDEVRLRPAKSFFDEVFHEAMCDRERPLVRRLLGGPRLELGLVARPDEVRAAVEAVPEKFHGGRRGWAIYVWRMTTAELWLRQQAGESLEQILAGEPIPKASWRLVTA